MSDSEFEALVRAGIDALPEWVQQKLVNVVFLVRDEPTHAQRMEQGLHMDETLFGLYEGVPLIERGIEPPLMPDTITIFKTPILEAHVDIENIRICIQNTVWHEVAHFFGHDETWVAEEEVARGKTL